MIRLSPAKINLGLRITGKRKDGYHTVHSVMIPVPFYDLIEIIPTGNKEPGAEFTQSGIVPDGSADENLCVKAYKLFSQHCKIGSARIHLHKQIPFGAGLGGGSSNAATVIISLNDLFGAPLSEKSLENMAAKLGSDCPFFLYHRPMLMEGRGEILTPIPFNTENYFLVIFNPGIIISTAEAYRLVKPGKQGISLPELISEPVNRWKDTIRNDFEEPV
ncbi:MAG TPA: 4-(cytidine 5'-diphospho)-2-C-methyl-D-erythritol kinase, partial [Bacteroidaceae bacterium]|nr:4-(cytidine 5'-diphospho)-2-C-methyl-D-erythritol kinase [Bacteroidaceae bacterium]